MLFLYDIGIQIYFFLIRLASIKNKKAAMWIGGRKGIIRSIASQIDKGKRPIWFHFASLGEFEQGRPVLEEIKLLHPDSSIIITFFSPSGYEIRKNYNLADHVFYLPLDTGKNAKEFIRIVNPSAAIFTKYEYWYHYFDELKKNDIPLFIISGIFREKQPFFKWYGKLHRTMLEKVSHFFVQNEQSRELLKNIKFTNVTVNGDTRFDRVYQNSLKTPANIYVDRFSTDKKVFIAGSTWLEDEQLLTAIVYENPDWKFIIAPHEVSLKRVEEVERLFPNSIRYSKFIEPGEKGTSQVLIIDNIGMLSSLYQYAGIAYIGGGFGVGIHNTLEAAAFGLPLIFGPNYRKFQEAKDLIELGAAFTIKDGRELTSCFETLKTPEEQNKRGGLAKDYVSASKGATQSIISYLKQERIIT
jgi:3-deoxy-D-manno-octulosonic-acid transferase